jgi:serine/threonine protein phosphatase PrpC
MIVKMLNYLEFLMVMEFMEIKSQKKYVKEFSSNKFETINLQNLKGENFQKLNKRKINKINENIRNKFKQLTPSSSKKKSLVFSRFKKISNIFNNTISKKTNLQNIYNILSSNNYFQIFNSFNKIDKILHEKYTENKICDGTGTALSFILLFNDYSKNNNIYCERNYNKIISCNLGNTKSILITEDKIIKELNICHTPCIKEERIRIEKNGGKIDRIDWLKVGPLRVWFKEKKYPGLTITRSLGDFEAESLGILSIPDIKEFDIDEERVKIVIIGTNGIWEFLTNDKIMETAWGFYDYDDAEGAANKIIELAGKLWKIKNPNNIPDLTVVVLFFK